MGCTLVHYTGLIESSVGGLLGSLRLWDRYWSRVPPAGSVLELLGVVGEEWISPEVGTEVTGSVGEILGSLEGGGAGGTPP